MLWIVLSAVGGCGEWPAVSTNRQELPAAEPPARPEAQYLSKTAVQADPDNKTDNAVDAALEWAKKYAEVSDKAHQFQRENRSLVQGNQDLQQQVVRLQADLNRAEKELAEANALLLEMRQELTKWKQNVLGFRDEMRTAQQAELEALLKILNLMGAEPARAGEPTTQLSSTEKEPPGGQAE